MLLVHTSHDVVEDGVKAEGIAEADVGIFHSTH